MEFICYMAEKLWITLLYSERCFTGSTMEELVYRYMQCLLTIRDILILATDAMILTNSWSWWYFNKFMIMMIDQIMWYFCSFYFKLLKWKLNRNIYHHKGRTIWYPGGVRKFKKKNHPRSGKEKKNSPMKWARKKIHPPSGKISTVGVYREEKKSPPKAQRKK